MTLEELREKIPAFPCKKDCGDCCSYHCTMSAEEMDRIHKRYPEVTTVAPDFYCGNIAFWEYCMFLGPDKKCTVYEERPIRCRTFGCTDEEDSQYCCPHGCKPAHPWTEEHLLKVLAEYDKIIKGQDEYITFGLVDGQIKPITRGANG